MMFKVQKSDLGQELELPHETTNVVLIVDNKQYWPASGKLTFNFDAERFLGFGNFSASMRDDSPVTELENGIFSISPFK